jgi:sulfur relay (sulfurtransferase) DsrF/TusC family protein
MYDMFHYFASSPFPSMTNINITEHGVYKLLKNQKPHKATGPDEVPA